MSKKVQKIFLKELFSKSNKFEINSTKFSAYSGASMGIRKQAYERKNQCKVFILI